MFKSLTSIRKSAPQLLLRSKPISDFYPKQNWIRNPNLILSIIKKENMNNFEGNVGISLYESINYYKNDK
jgi:hypothetical protein